MSNRKNKQEELFPREPATAAMKAVAESTADARKLTKSFSPNEIEEILAKRDGGGKLEPVETAAIRTKYRQIKHQIKELEHGNNSNFIDKITVHKNTLVYHIYGGDKIKILGAISRSKNAKDPCKWGFL